MNFNIQNPTHCTIYTWDGTFLARVAKDEDGIFTATEAFVDNEWVSIDEYFTDTPITSFDYRVMEEPTDIEQLNKYTASLTLWGKK